MVIERPSRRLIAYSTAVLVVAGSCDILRRLPAVSAAAAAPVLLLEVLLIARAWGTGPALAGSTTAGAVFSYYFFPPGWHFLQDLNDWVAFFTFTVTAILVGELSARAERRQIEAEQGRREIEQLYQQLNSAFERASDAEAARRNEQLKAALLDALTHNLRTPLTAIKASVTALLGASQTAAGTKLTNESRSDLLHVIDEESDRLNRFIEGLSVADRPDADYSPQRRPMRLEAMVDAALRRASTVLRDHQVVRSVPANLPGLAVEPGAVVEVLYMLLDNASKYSPSGTVIRVDAASVDPRHVRIAVSDEGPGIPSHYREQVFEKFFRVPGREPLDPRRGGIGLGLAIVRRLIESQAGTIGIEVPDNGHGTRVVLTLPAADVYEDTPAAETAASA